MHKSQYLLAFEKNRLEYTASFSPQLHFEDHVYAIGIFTKYP